MAYVKRDKSRGKLIVRCYAGIKPENGRPFELSRTLPIDASDATVEAAVEELEEKAAMYKSEPLKASLGSLLDFCLDELDTNLSPTTVEAYRSLFRKHVKPMLGRIKYEDLTPSHFTRLYLRMSSEGLSRRTISKTNAALKGRFKRLKRAGIIESNPLSDMSYPPGDLPESKALSERDFMLLDGYLKETIERGFKDAETWDEYMLAMAFRLVLYTGMRRGECAALRRSSFRQPDELRIKESMVFASGSGYVRKQPKSKASKRNIKLDDYTADRLTKYLRHQAYWLRTRDIFVESDTPMFTLHDGGVVRPERLSDEFKLLAKSLRFEDKHAHLHTLRHTHATYLLESGTNIKTVKERLGHADVATTGNIYSHVMAGADEAAARSFADFGETVTERSRNAGYGLASQTGLQPGEMPWNGD